MFDIEGKKSYSAFDTASRPESHAQSPLNVRGAYLGLLLGRLFLGAIFFISALVKVSNYQNTVDQLLIQGVLYADFYLNIAIVMEFIGSLCLITGLYSSTAALVLFFYLVPVTLLFHDFWAVPGAEQRYQIISFMKNMAIMGGLLIAACVGPGPWSMNSWHVMLQRNLNHDWKQQ